MSEFKGTKGKWIVFSNAKYSDVVKIKSDKGSPTFRENEANALLISKAPEMLEMLIKIEDILNYDTIEGNSPIQENIYKLIKEATELWIN